MTNFPLKFEVMADSKYGISEPWQCSANALQPITVSIPAEFNGPGKAYSPEDLYGLAVLNCLISVYKYLCETNKVVFEKIDGKLIVTMDKKQQNGQLILTHLDITFNVYGSQDKEKARELLERAIRECPVTNSIKSGKTCHINID